jgi:hypothetical protein
LGFYRLHVVSYRFHSLLYAKKIKTSELRVGMFVTELCGSWIDTPFWKKSFLLSDSAELLEIQKSKIQEAWIDTSKGLDVLQAEPEAKQEPEPVVETVVVKQPVPRQTAPVSMAEEIDRASLIVNKSRAAVFSMFSEARMGKAVDVGNAQEMVRKLQTL